MRCGDCEWYKAHNCRHQCMNLPDGYTCADCVHDDWCFVTFGVLPDSTSCDFEPIRFKARKAATA